MFRFSHRDLAVGTGTILLGLSIVSAAAAQEGGTVPVREITRLGGSTALYKSPLKTVASLNRMAGDPEIVANVRTILSQAGMAELADDVVATLVAATTSVRGGVCNDATPADGVIVECEVQPGQTLQWMAYRPHGGPAVGLLREIRWAGRRSFEAYLFRVTEDNRTYTFVIPKVCGNVSLLSVHESARVSVARPPPPMPVAPMTPPPFPLQLLAAVVLPPPPAQASPLPPPVQAVVRTSPFFIDALIGKDRRVRPIAGRSTVGGSNAVGNVGTANVEFAQCSPLLGFKIGVAKKYENDWELAGAVGVAVSLVRADHKVNEHEVFADVEANKYLNGGVFIGTGLSMWGLTHGDTLTPAWMVHVGLPLARNARFPVYFLTEGRIFLDNANDISNNYQFWGGVRVHF